MKKRILSLILAVLLLSALVLNVSAYNKQFDRPTYTLYASNSCTTTSAQVSTTTDNPDLLVSSKMVVYTEETENRNTVGYANTSNPQNYASRVTVNGANVHHCWGTHYEGSSVAYEGRSNAN